MIVDRSLPHRSPEVAQAESEIWAAEQDLKEDAKLIGEKALIELAPVKMVRRHPLTAIALVSFAAYLVYRIVTSWRPSSNDETLPLE